MIFNDLIVSRETISYLFLNLAVVLVQREWYSCLWQSFLEVMGTQYNRLQQKLHKTSAKSLAFTAFLIRIGFIPAIWELPVLLMPITDKVLAHILLLLLSLLWGHAAVLLSGTRGRAALQTMPKEACFRALKAEVPVSAQCQERKV